MPDQTLGRYKRPNEEFRIAWDFVNDLESGDTVNNVGSGSTVTAKQVDTGADVSSTFLEGATRSGTSLRVQVQAGTVGKDYEVAFKAQTSQGDVFERIVLVRVRDAP